MRKPSISKIIASNRSRKIMPGVKALSASSMGKPKKMEQEPMIPGGIGAAMKKGGASKKPKMGIAIMIAIGKKKGKK